MVRILFCLVLQLTNWRKSWLSARIFLSSKLFVSPLIKIATSGYWVFRQLYVAVPGPVGQSGHLTDDGCPEQYSWFSYFLVSFDDQCTVCNVQFGIWAAYGCSDRTSALRVCQEVWIWDVTPVGMYLKTRNSPLSRMICWLTWWSSRWRRLTTTTHRTGQGMLARPMLVCGKRSSYKLLYYNL